METKENYKVESFVGPSKKQKIRSEINQKHIKSLKTKKQFDPEAPSSCIKLSRIPYGFFEQELLKYFMQFGRVQRIRVARNKKTGNHKGWAFIQFANSIVAKIAAETMDGYLMFDKVMLCRVLKNSEVPKCLSKGKRLLPRPSKYATARRHTRKACAEKTEAQVRTAKARLLSQLRKNNKKFTNLGIDYQFDLSCLKKPWLAKKENEVCIKGDNEESESSACRISPYLKGDKKKKRLKRRNENEDSENIDRKRSLERISRKRQKRKVKNSGKAENFKKSSKNDLQVTKQKKKRSQIKV